MPSGRKRQENAKNFKWLSQIIVKNVNSTTRSFYFCDKNKDSCDSNFVKVATRKILTYAVSTKYYVMILLVFVNRFFI